MWLLNLPILTQLWCYLPKLALSETVIRQEEVEKTLLTFHLSMACSFLPWYLLNMLTPLQGLHRTVKQESTAMSNFAVTGLTCSQASQAPADHVQFDIGIAPWQLLTACFFSPRKNWAAISFCLQFLMQGHLVICLSSSPCEINWLSPQPCSPGITCFLTGFNLRNATNSI